LPSLLNLGPTQHSKTKAMKSDKHLEESANRQVPTVTEDVSVHAHARVYSVRCERLKQRIESTRQVTIFLFSPFQGMYEERASL